MARIMGINRLVRNYRMGKETEKRVRNLIRDPQDPELTLRTLDKILKTQGVKTINENFSSSSPQFRYCDTGDRYALTVGYDYYERKFIIANYGNLIEKACI
jgi:hypothetical protein